MGVIINSAEQLYKFTQFSTLKMTDISNRYTVLSSTVKTVSQKSDLVPQSIKCKCYK